MKIIKFDITNFKGIERASVYLDDNTPGNVVTLIGLNESGKTTVLEALSQFITEDKDTAILIGTVQKKHSPQELIPKNQKAAFTGVIIVEATVILEKDDISELNTSLRDNHKLMLDEKSLDRVFTIQRTYEFEDSLYKGASNIWSPTFYCKSSRARNFKEYTADRSKSENRAIWLACIKVLNDRLPKIVYFPTFLFEFPEKIYLEKTDDNVNLYYTQVLQDVLDSLDESLSIAKHVVERIDRLRKSHSDAATFMAFLFNRDEKKQIDAVFQKAANKMSEVIFGSWNQILGRSISGKRVHIDWMLDGNSHNSVYIEISIVDGAATYGLSERSLGFRWFFAFLLFTQFRRNRNEPGGTIFLFDEPAANLHSKAQMKLLESFSRIATGTTYVIYSTHSHYMVNPLWLEKACIVENKATDYDNEDEVDSFIVRNTDRNIVKYKTFVGTNPTKTTYFQPVLDALEVTFSPLLRSSKALIVEGKNDFFPIVFFRRALTAATLPDIFPGNGASGASNMINLFRGWGVTFRIILDDDKAGRIAKRKYVEEFFLKEAEVVTLGDISGSLAGKEFEHIYQEDVRLAAAQFFGVAKLTKRQYALYFQELLSSKNDVQFPDTEKAFKQISEWIDKEFAD